MNETAWGRYRIAGPAHGRLIRELVVYPPGLTAGERTAIEIDRLAPVAGAAIGLVVGMLTFDVLPRWTLVVVLLGGVGGAVALARRLTVGVRGRIRSISVSQSLLSDPPTVTGDAELLDRCLLALRRLDADASGLTRVEYERRWGEVYHCLPTGSGSAQHQGTERTW